MTGLEAESYWTEETKTLCRLYEALQPALSDLPAQDLLELSRKIATDLVFRISALSEPGLDIESALTSISTICQSCAFSRDSASN